MISKKRGIGIFMWGLFLGFGSIGVLEDFLKERLGRMTTTYVVYWNTISLDLSM